MKQAYLCARCRRMSVFAGSGMIELDAIAHIPGGKIKLHNMKWTRCKRCGRTHVDITTMNDIHRAKVKRLDRSKS